MSSVVCLVCKGSGKREVKPGDVVSLVDGSSVPPAVKLSDENGSYNGRTFPSATLRVLITKSDMVFVTHTKHEFKDSTLRFAPPPGYVSWYEREGGGYIKRYVGYWLPLTHVSL